MQKLPVCALEVTCFSIVTNTVILAAILPSLTLLVHITLVHTNIHSCYKTVKQHISIKNKQLNKIVHFFMSA